MVILIVSEGGFKGEGGVGGVRMTDKQIASVQLNLESRYKLDEVRENNYISAEKRNEIETIYKEIIWNCNSVLYKNPKSDERTDDFLDIAHAAGSLCGMLDALMTVLDHMKVDLGREESDKVYTPMSHYGPVMLSQGLIDLYNGNGIDSFEKKVNAIYGGGRVPSLKRLRVLISRKAALKVAQWNTCYAQMRQSTIHMDVSVFM